MEARNSREFLDGFESEPEKRSPTRTAGADSGGIAPDRSTACASNPGQR